MPGFEIALDLLVDTLELDLHLSADDVPVVWHDPVVEADKCEVATPTRVRATPAAELRDIRCATNPDPDRFPDQKPEPGVVSGDDFGIVSLTDLFEFVAAYSTSPDKTEAQRANAETVRFNVETKRKPDDPSAIGDGFDGTMPGVFERALIEAADAAGVLERVTVQSFDHRSLWAIAAIYSDASLAALTRRNDAPDLAALAELGAAIWSPDYRSLDEGAVAQASGLGMLVIPWTVNDPGDMAALLALGVDGIITDRPDLAP